MVALFALLLVTFLIAFYEFELVVQFLNSIFAPAAQPGKIVIASSGNAELLLSTTNLRAFLGAGIVFFEIMIVLLSVSDTILETLKAAIRPVAALVPLMAFLYSAYETFSPLFWRVIQVDDQATGMASMVESPNFTSNVFGTFAWMLIFLLFVWILGVRDNTAEVRRLREELKKLQQQQKKRR